MAEGWLRHSWPHILTILLGSIVVFLAHPLILPMYLVLVAITMVWFWGSICTNCNSWGSRGCPSRYGELSARFFKKAKEPNFRKAFKNNIWTVALQWFFPLLVGLLFLITDFSIVLLLTLGTFCIVGFVILPVLSRGRGCERCPQKNDCPFKK